MAAPACLRPALCAANSVQPPPNEQVHHRRCQLFDGCRSWPTRIRVTQQPKHFLSLITNVVACLGSSAVAPHPQPTVQHPFHPPAYPHTACRIVCPSARHFTACSYIDAVISCCAQIGINCTSAASCCCRCSLLPASGTPRASINTSLCNPRPLAQPGGWSQAGVWTTHRV